MVMNWWSCRSYRPSSAASACEGKARILAMVSLPVAVALDIRQVVPVTGSFVGAFDALL